MTEKEIDIKIKKVIENYKQNLKELQKIGFNNEQIREIWIGLEHNVDISEYADLKFDHLQMKEIRKGLEDKLDISKYVKPEFDWKQMAEIRKDLKAEKSGEKKEPEMEI